MAFGQVVVGPPGSGKTTYCNGMSQFLSLIGRKVAVINLDPANDSLPYECAVNIEELVKLNDVMVEHSLGPNGDFNLDFYTDVLDLEYLQHVLDQDPRSARYSKMTKELCDVIEQFGIVNFTTLDIQDKESVGKLVKLIDKTNGYIFAGIEASAVEFSKIAVGPVDWDYYRVAEVQEKYMKDDDNIDDNE